MFDGRAERHVTGRIEAALGTLARLHPNVRWSAPTRPGGPARDGEIDILVVHPAYGLLAIEVKSGAVRRDGYGRWYAGGRGLRESPFAQAETGVEAVAHTVESDPRWCALGAAPLRRLHAVAFPDVDRSSLRLPSGDEPIDLGPDAPIELVIGREDLISAEATADALDRVFGWWSGDGARDRDLDAHAVETIESILEPDVELRGLIRGDIAEGEIELLAPTHHQLGLLHTLRHEHRAAIEGGAGSGKTIVAIAKARALAAWGFDVLFVCFNQPLAHAVAADPDLRGLIEGGRLTVTTFHQLCRDLGEQAGTLREEPPPAGSPAATAWAASDAGRRWFSETLPRALDEAIPKLARRWQALVIDEGQDFAPEWLESLAFLLVDPAEDDLYVFHDPAQAIYRTDATSVLGLRPFDLPDNCRNARPIHEFAYRWYTGDVAAEPMREDGREPEIIVAEEGEPTLVALRTVLHRLVGSEGVERSQIAVLTGVALERSAVWRRHRFKGGLELWNGSVDRDGHSLGRAFDEVPAQASGTILCDTIHRFKGLEREVVVLVELNPADERIGRLLYIGASRAKHHLVLVVSPELSQLVGTNRMTRAEARSTDDQRTIRAAGDRGAGDA